MDPLMNTVLRSGPGRACAAGCHGTRHRESLFPDTTREWHNQRNSVDRTSRAFRRYSRKPSSRLAYISPALAYWSTESIVFRLCRHAVLQRETSSILRAPDCASVLRQQSNTERENLSRRDLPTQCESYPPAETAAGRERPIVD